jgi:acetamidase/formamidase
MTEHQLEPTPDTTVNFFSNELPPVLTVDPGDSVVVRSLDAAGFLARQQSPGDEQLTMFAGEWVGHCPVVDLRITQVANQSWGVHAVLPHDAIRAGIAETAQP